MPQLVRMVLDIREQRQSQQKLEKVGPLVDICAAITNKRRKKLSMSAVSTKLDNAEMKRLNDREHEFKFSLFEKEMDNRAWNRNAFVPSILHTAFAFTVVPYLNAKTTISAFAQDPGLIPVCSLLNDNGYYAHSVAGLFLWGGFFWYMKRNPFWTHFSQLTVHRIAPIWKMLYGFGSARYDPATTTMIPLWLSYLRFDKERFEQGFTFKKTPNEIMKSEIDVERTEALLYGAAHSTCQVFVALITFALGPLAILYFLGALSGFTVRQAVWKLHAEAMRQKYEKQQRKWMPLGPRYDE